jgi:hypothetical protein
MDIGAPLAKAGDGAAAHERRNVRWGDTQKFAEQGGIDKYIASGNLDGCCLALRAHLRPR